LYRIDYHLIGVFWLKSPAFVPFAIFVHYSLNCRYSFSTFCSVTEGATVISVCLIA
jgi:hypothetical protein